MEEKHKVNYRSSYIWGSVVILVGIMLSGMAFYISPGIHDGSVWGIGVTLAGVLY